MRATDATTVDAVRLTGVSVRYRGGGLGVAGVTLRVPRGQVVAVFGPNGAGKTTIARAISGFLKTEGARVVDGEVDVLGRRVSDWEPHRIAALGVTSVPERTKVFPALTVRENLLAVGRPPSRAELPEALDRVCQLFPIIASRRDELAGRLSGGERQMLALARCFFTRPKVVVVDEMTLGLHHSIHAPLFAAVEAMAETDTAVVVIDESTRSVLDVADYCYLVRDGGIADEGPPAKFQAGDVLAVGYTAGGGGP